jgi:hypothetical protein
VTTCFAPARKPEVGRGGAFERHRRASVGLHFTKIATMSWPIAPTAERAAAHAAIVAARAAAWVIASCSLASVAAWSHLALRKFLLELLTSSLVLGLPLAPGLLLLIGVFSIPTDNLGLGGSYAATAIEGQVKCVGFQFPSIEAAVFIADGRKIVRVGQRSILLFCAYPRRGRHLPLVGGA